MPPMHESTCRENATRRSEAPEVLDGVDDSLGVLRGRTDEKNRVVIDGRAHGSDICAPVRSNSNPAAFDAEVSAGLLEGCVSRGGQHDVRAGNVTPTAPCGVRGHEKALGASGGEESGPTRRRVEQVGDEAQNVGLHAPQTGKCSHVEGVFSGVCRIRTLRQIQGFGRRQIRQAERLAAAPINVISTQRLETRENLINGLFSGLHWRRVALQTLVFLELAVFYIRYIMGAVERFPGGLRSPKSSAACR